MPDLEDIYQFVRSLKDLALFAAPFLLVIMLLLWFWMRSAARAHRRRQERAEETFGIETRFHEAGVSGYSHKNLLARWSGAQRCLEVRVTTDREIWVQPVGFLNYGNESDLEHRIPCASVLSAALAPSVLQRRGVHLDFRLPDGATRRLTLILRDPQGFLAALREPAGDAPG